MDSLEILDLVIYPIYIVTSTILSFFIIFNQKRIKKRYKIDVTISFMLLYVSNFLICYFNFESLNMYFRVAIPLIILFIVIYISNKVQIIGLTGKQSFCILVNYISTFQGGISCGKSAVSEYLKNHLRLSIIDCDVLARRVVEVGKPAYKELVTKYGDQILNSEGQIDRQRLGKLVFEDKKIRRDVTKITGKQIFIEILKEVYKIAFKQKEKLIVLDAPILYETKYLEYVCYPIIVVYVSQESIQIERLVARDNITEEQAITKIRAQMPLAKKIEKADILICNDKKKEDLPKQINKIILDLVL